MNFIKQDRHDWEKVILLIKSKEDFVNLDSEESTIFLNEKEKLINNCFLFKIVDYK